MILDMKGMHPHQSVYSSTIHFGKYKGRHFGEANEDDGLFKWIEQLSHSPNPKSAAVGKWYLANLNQAPRQGLQVYLDPEQNDLHALIAGAREQLADLDATYTEEHQVVESIRSKLFILLRPSYEKRDDLLIKVDYRRRFLEALMKDAKEVVETILEEERQASDENHQNYEQAANDASEKRLLSSEEQAELREIYRRLAVLYHPDRNGDDPSKQAAFAELMKIINQAKDSGAIDLLRQIAMDPSQFLVSHGYEFIAMNDEKEIEGLRSLLQWLRDKILESKKLLDDLRGSSDYELWKLCEQDPDFLEVIAKEQQNDLESEIGQLEEECNSLAKQINELVGPDSPYRV